VYLPGDAVLKTSIGNFPHPIVPDPGTSLVCRTENVNTQCCRNSDGGNVGEWFFPDGSIVPRYRANPNANFSRSGFAQHVRLNRGNNGITPTGSYECRVPDDSGNLQIAGLNITLALGKLISSLLQYALEYCTTQLLIHTDVNGRSFSNHHILNNFTLGSTIRCMSIGPCCSLNPHLSDYAQRGISPSGTGSWRYPNGSYVLQTLADGSFGITRHPGHVNLHRLGSHSAEGVWRCEMPGRDGATDISYIGIYTEGHGMQCLLSCTHELTVYVCAN
jgi:hypothetical protein